MFSQPLRTTLLGGLTLLVSSASPAVDPNTLRAVKLGGGQVEVSWQDASPTSYCVRRDGLAPPGSALGGTLGLAWVDAPPAAPLWFYAVEESAICLTSVCSAPLGLACAARSVMGNNGSPGSTDVVDSYPACGASGLDGPELVYRLAPAQDVALSLRLGGLGSDLDVLVLEDLGSGCDPLGCIASGDSQVQLSLLAGRIYYVVVDGRAGAVSDFTLDISCSGTLCAPALDIACGAQINASNAGAGSSRVLDGYSPCGATGLDGPEQVYRLRPAASVPVTLDLASPMGDLDLLVMRDSGAGCSANECIEHGDTQIQFNAVGGETYYVAVDGRGGAVSDFTLDVTCAAPPACASAGTLVCRTPAIGRSDDPGSSDVVDAWPCGGGDTSGPEIVHTFTPTGSGNVTFSLSPSTASLLDIFVLSAAGGCTPGSCIGYGDTSVTVSVVAGTRYYVVLDGPAPAGYNLTASCSFPAGSCSPVLPLQCGDVLFGDTASGLATNVSDMYACSPNPMTGPELSYEFAPPNATTDYLVTATLELLTQDLDIFALENQGSGCAASGCVAWDDRSVVFQAAAAKQYFLSVDGRNGVTSGFRVLVDCIVAPGMCVPAEDIACGALLSGRSNSDPGSTDVIDAYPSCPPIVFNETGPEYTYRFQPTQSQSVSVELRNPTGGTPHVYVLEDRGAGCDPLSCAAKGTTRVTFAASAGTTYYIVTDGFNGGSARFDVSLTCN